MTHTATWGSLRLTLWLSQRLLTFTHTLFTLRASPLSGSPLAIFNLMWPMRILDFLPILIPFKTYSPVVFPISVKSVTYSLMQTFRSYPWCLPFFYSHFMNISMAWDLITWMPLSSHSDPGLNSLSSESFLSHSVYGNHCHLQSHHSI